MLLIALDNGPIHVNEYEYTDRIDMYSLRSKNAVMSVTISSSGLSLPISMDNPDVRQSIVRRLMAYGAERRKIEARLAVIGELEKELQDVLREIDQRGQRPLLHQAPVSPASMLQQGPNNTAIKEWLLAILQSGPKNLDELLKLANDAHISFGEKSGARVLHFNLLNLKNAHKIDREGERAWKLANS